MKIDPISVTELNKYVKNRIDEDEYLNNVLVKGEISNFKHHYTGHLYFTLKDENSVIKCIMFKTYAEKVNFEPQNGMKVIIFGTVSVFERDGVYQIYCKAIEGLFDEVHKKKIPFMPEVIGVLTSNTGSVIRDIINVSTRRNPNVRIRLFPVPVQGQGASEKIAKAIEIMNEKKLADVMIVGRGGGSLEDLWPFNEEIVARAIYNSDIPIISAVGHETDFTIADFVADLRAPTPSAAAELAVADVEDLKYDLSIKMRRLKNALKSKTEVMRLRFEKCMNSRVYKEPFQKINEKSLLLDKYFKSLENFGNKKINDSKFILENRIAKLDALSPLKTLTRGYSITTLKSDNKVIKSINDVKNGDEIEVRVKDGKINAMVTK